MVVFCSANPRITRRTSPVNSGSSAEVGSSKHRIFGDCANARAIATRCCCPPDNSHGYACIRFSNPTRTISSLPRSSISESTLRGCLHLRASSFGARQTFSRTVYCGKRLKFWKTKPKFNCLRRCSSRGTGFFSSASKIFSPSTNTCPDSACSRKVIHRSNVVFPLPDDPMMERTSPFSMEKSIPCRISSAPKLFLIFFTARIGIDSPPLNS
ncbi:putative glutamate binding periplasmic protein [Clostridium sp. CAG:448]|nr:putative glutamate binding periplasmic protein [Clostridium sp. CAG:448]